MAGWADRLWRIARRWGASIRELQAVILAIAAIIFGLSLGFVSLIPDIRSTGTTTFADTLAPFAEQNESVDIRTGLTELRLEIGSCAIFGTALNEIELAEMNDTGRRPAPQLDCNRRLATFSYPIRLVIVENRGASAEAYEISARFYEVRTPRSLLAIPAFPLILGGVIFLVLRGLRRGIVRIETERKTVKEEKR